ncbi:TIGR00730 family Rossman fold protein [Brevibacillus dissolubilis]|uniref:LOG family protein n=1 Tax=Brevibacillus dissolubilis TaxID=1844116 RepID=UPI001116B111|nr:TIGR00730 family Rossman fold protein [Brevibacillus dissolubilis]
MKRICVYAGSRPGKRPSYSTAAQQLGEELVKRNLELVYGGASVGLMGAVADTVMSQGGKAIGIMPKGLFTQRHSGLTEFHNTESMHERKAMMAELSDGFIALPGGFGSFEELFEAITWSQIGIHKKAVGLLNVEGFYDPLVRLVEHAIEEEFVPAESMGFIIVDADPASLLDKMAAFVPPTGKLVVE